LESGPKFSLVEQSTPGTEPKYTDTPWTVPLIAAHNWLKHDISRVIRASGRESGKSTRQPAKSNDVACSVGDFGRFLVRGISSV
jgi:hypothetical protein